MPADLRESLETLQRALENLGDACADAFATVTDVLEKNDASDERDPAYDPSRIDFGDPNEWHRWH